MKRSFLSDKYRFVIFNRDLEKLDYIVYCLIFLWSMGRSSSQVLYRMALSTKPRSMQLILCFGRISPVFWCAFKLSRNFLKKNQI